MVRRLYLPTSWVLALMLISVAALPPNYEDVELSGSQLLNEKVEVVQDSPQSNSVHVAHNIPTGSDISLKQTNAYNTSVHISLNIAKKSQVKVLILGAVNSAIHVSFNSASDSECSVQVDDAFNSSIHLSFQNPVRVPVSLKMSRPQLSSIHVSQNVPTESPVDVSIESPSNNSIHVSQSVPRKSPLTFTILGDNLSNHVEVSQNAPDQDSPKTCRPDCPQSPVQDYDYPVASSPQQPTVATLSTQAAASAPAAASGHTSSLQSAATVQDSPTVGSGMPPADESSLTLLPEYPDYDSVETRFAGGATSSGVPVCPGGSLDQCIDVCPGFHAQAYRVCVAQCGKRCT